MYQLDVVFTYEKGVTETMCIHECKSTHPNDKTDFRHVL